MNEMIRGALIDETERYRYSLWRIWDANNPCCLFIMLNPSTADGKEDDPTIRRCIGFAKSWGFGSLQVINLFAYRATDPRELLKVEDPEGPDNIHHALAAIREAHTIVCAWGAVGFAGRALRTYERMIDALAEYDTGKTTGCLGTTKDGMPRHPLYVKADTRLQSYIPPGYIVPSHKARL